MIPKIIHFCWFGRGKKTKLAKKCIKTWEKYCPDYEIIEWTEDNFDVYQNAYTKYCYENQKWAYLSDYVRLYVVNKYGGIYFDTDVELIKPIKELHRLEAFYGFENEKYVNSGLGFGAIKNHPTIVAMLREYDKLVTDGNGRVEVIGCPIINTKALLFLGLNLNGSYQLVEGANIFPVEYFNPLDDATGRINKTNNTYSIHWYAKSALSVKTKIRSRITRPIHRLLGVNCFEKIKRILNV